MRPSDENQHRSKRPNLFSASNRPAGGDDNILAKLDKQAPAAAQSGQPRTRAVWIAAAGVLVAGLIASLAILAQQQSERGPHRFDNVAAAPQPVVTVAAGGGEGQADNAAQIIDEAPVPLVTLANAPAPAVVPAPVVVKTPVAVKAPAVVRAPVAVVAAAPARSAVSAPAKAAYRSQGGERVAAPARTVAARAIERTAQVLPARKTRPPAVRADAAPVDTDVAILTAILAQSRQAAEREPAGGACGGARCAPRASAQ